MKRFAAWGFALLLATSAAAVTFAAEKNGNTPARTGGPTYPIAAEVYTTLERTIVPLPHDAQTLMPKQVSEYAAYHYGEWDWNGPGFPYLRPDLQSGDVVPSVRDPRATTLLSFFTMSDVHIVDKESPTQCINFGYENNPGDSSSAYSAVILFSTHVLDAAVQTINAMHRKVPFDFGIGLGDAANNTEYNELRWYIDVLDGQPITPSSGAHAGADTTLYQKPYQAAGLDPSLPWYQAMGNHDQFWMGSAPVNDYLRPLYTGTDVLDLGLQTPPDFDFNTRGFYMGLVDGTTEFGDIIDVGPTSNYPVPPQIVADPLRRSLSAQDWMSEFLVSPSQPAGHGFTQEMVRSGLACYHFHPRSNIPLKVIVLDDTDKVGGGADAALDYQRYGWLVNELDEGEAAGELMIICAHIPIRPYAPGSAYQPWSLWSPQADVSEQTVLDKLHSYKNLLLWVAGHVHRNAITPQPSPDGNPENGFWEVETPSLRDFPQQFRRFEIVRNSDNTISIFALDVDPAVNWTPLPDGSSPPAWTSRSYAIATQQIFGNLIGNGPHVDPASGTYNAELVKQLSPAMQAKLAGIVPVVDSLRIEASPSIPTIPVVTLANTVTGSVPTHYLASESADFGDAAWQPYTKAPSFTLGSTVGVRTVYFKVKDGSGAESNVVNASFTDAVRIQAVTPASVMVNTNHSAVLQVACTGAAPISFQWYEGTSGDTSKPVAGATQAVFRSPGILADTRFWVRASNGFSQADSQAVPVVLWNRYYIPHALSSDFWWSSLRLVNADGLPSGKKSVPTGQAAISAFTADGALLETRTVRIPALNCFTADIRDLFSPETLAADIWVKIESKDELKGLMEFGTTDLAAQTALPIREEPERKGLFSHIAMEGNGYTGLALLNTAPQAANVILTAYSETGLALGQKSETIGPNGKFTRLVSEVFSTGIDPAAIRSIGVDSSQPLVGFEIFGDLQEKVLSGLPFDPQEEIQPGKTTGDLVYAELPNRDLWQTWATFANRAAEAATVTARVFDQAGTELGVETFPLGPQQQVTREFGELFPAEKYAGAAYFVLADTRQVTGSERVLSRLAPFRFDGLVALAPSAGPRVFPLAPGDSLFHTDLCLVNGAATGTALTVTAYSAAGTSLGSCPVSLDGHAKRVLDVGAAIPTTEPVAWLLVTGDGLFTADAFILSMDSQRLMVYEGLPLE